MKKGTHIGTLFICLSIKQDPFQEGVKVIKLKLIDVNIQVCNPLDLLKIQFLSQRNQKIQTYMLHILNKFWPS